MDAEATAGYREACAQCSALDWGVSDEGRFYCRTCHNVTERSQEVEEASFTPGSGRLSTVSRGRRRRTDRGRAWFICEGFQVILRVQAEALLTLGVCQDFKDQVLCEMWRLYLQKSGEAYTHRPARSSTFRLDSDSSRTVVDSEEEASEADLECSSVASAGSSVEDNWHLCGGRGQPGLTMRTTLALLHLALVWSREALTLSDLLRLVDEGHIPYMHAYEHLPDEMKVEGKAAVIFREESVPSHYAVHREAESLLSVLQLPDFPPISSQSLLHPARLSLRYLLDANLPSQLHPLLCRLIERSEMLNPHLYTCGSAPPALPLYDVQTAAHILVTMKLLYGLDDRTEWDLCSQMSDLHQPGEQQKGEEFSLRRWYRLLHQVLSRAEKRKKLNVSRKQWKDTSKPLSLNRKNRCILMKKKRTAEQLRSCLQKLSPQPTAQQLHPSIFRFCWGDQGGADGPSFHLKKLPGVLTHPLRRSWYWHPALKRCHPGTCGSHYQQVEDTLPHSFKWFLRLFSFLLDIRTPCLYEEVLKVERRLFSRHTPTWTIPR